MKRLKQLLAVLGAISLLAISAPVASAYTGGCTDTIGSGILYVKLFEFENYGWDNGVHKATLCIRASATGSTNVPDLNNVNYNAQGDNVCDGQLIQDFGNWNDCASSIQSQFSDCHHTVTVYSGINYQFGYTGGAGAGEFPSWSSTANFPNLDTLNASPDPQNSISSLKVTYHAACQSFAG